jgi:hypothetical protein
MHKWVTMSNMEHEQRGALDVLLVPFILLCMLLIGVGIFAYWAYGGRQDYKNNADQKIAAAVVTAKQQTEASDAQQYTQESKDPLATFVGPSSSGSVVVKYPKTWSAYVAQEPTSQNPIDGYFYPNVVPDITNPDNSYALRVQLLEQSYTSVMQQYTGLVTTGQLKITPYTLPKVPSVIGSYVQGQIEQNKQGSMVILPLLNMTLEVWTESSQFQSDFTTNVLPNLSFQP